MTSETMDHVYQAYPGSRRGAGAGWRASGALSLNEPHRPALPWIVQPQCGSGGSERQRA